MSNTALFSPMKLGKHELKHRIALVPLTRFRADENAVPTDLQAEYYEQRATDGGLLITEATFITHKAGSYPRAPGIYTKEQIEGWKKVTQRVHAKGGIIFLQLWHIGRAAMSANIGEQPVSASDIAIEGVNLLGLPQEKPRALSIPEIKEIVGQYRQAALNAMEAGFDGVEIHSANGYLLDQFLNTSSNKRTDIYGGSAENRCRFPLEVVDAVVDAVGADRTGIRLSPWSFFQDAADEKPYETWGYITQALQDRHPDMAYLDFIEPRADFQADSYDEKQADTLDPFRKIWKGPFISAGGYTYNTQAAFDVAEKTGNIIGFGRLFISNPDLVERLRNGWPLNKYDRNTFYTNDAAGYVDYPFYKKD